MKGRPQGTRTFSTAAGPVHCDVHHDTNDTAVVAARVLRARLKPGSTRQGRKVLRPFFLFRRLNATKSLNAIKESLP